MRTKIRSAANARKGYASVKYKNFSEALEKITALAENKIIEATLKRVRGAQIQLDDTDENAILMEILKDNLEEQGYEVEEIIKRVDGDIFMFWSW